MSEVLPGIWDVTSKFSPTRNFKWVVFGSRRGGATGRAIQYEGMSVRRKSEVIYKQGSFAILKHYSYSYRSGQTCVAGMTRVATCFELVRVEDGTLEFSGTLTILMTLECGHKWKQGIEFLKSQMTHFSPIPFVHQIPQTLD